MNAVATETTFWSEKELFSRECCCCSKNDCDKDIYTEYYYSGVREIYSEMIMDTFNININMKESNIVCKKYICDQCIRELKNAYSFKSNILKNYQVMEGKINEFNKHTKYDMKLETDQFQDGVCELFYDSPKTIINGVKRKKFNSDLNFVKKEIVDNSDLKLKQNSGITGKRKKLKDNEKGDGLDNKEKTLKNVKNKYKIVSKSTILRKNSVKLITNSSLWVFNWSEGRYRCFCCKEPYSDIKLLKKHTETHKIEEIEAKIQNSENNLVKVEVSDVYCKICKENFNNLTSLVDHFNLHSIKITSHLLVPIKINDFTCQICEENYTNFHFLYRHMIKHYQTVICDKCGAGFYQKRHLKQHLSKNHDPERTKTLPRKGLKCHFCSERFKQFHIRILHMIEKHGLERPHFPCNLCDKTFLTRGILNAHIKNSHNIKEKIFECNICMKKFNIKNSLVRHRDTHTDGINYNCSICNHGFKLVTSLRRHIKQKHTS